MDLKSFVNAVAEMSSGKKTDSVLAKETAIEQFRRRFQFAKKQQNYNNNDLPAGSPVYVYCKSCGILVERLPEDYLFPTFSECSQCQGLKQAGWLNEAVKLHGKALIPPKKPSEVEVMVAEIMTNEMITEIMTEYKTEDRTEIAGGTRL